MTKNKRNLIIKSAIVLSMLIIGIYFYDQLPDSIPIHRNLQGQVDNYGSKSIVVFLIPPITALMVILFQFLPKLDPKKANYPKFAKTREIIQFALIGLMAYIYFVSLFITIHPAYNINYFIAPGIGLLFVIMGNYMGKIKHNFFVGIKTPWTIADEEVWEKTHRLGGRIRVISGIWIIAQIALKTINPIFLFGPIIAVALVPIIYSYIIFQKKQKMK